jgi:hypothetical protein
MIKTLPTRFHVDVLKSDIDNSEKRCAQRCMIATAVKRILGESNHGYVAVRSNGVAITVGDYRHSYKLPRVPVRRLIEFDMGDTVEPFSFNMALAETRKKSPPATQARKDRINELRREWPARLGRVYGM